MFRKGRKRFDKDLFEKSITSINSSPKEKSAVIAREQIVILGRSVLPELLDRLKNAQTKDTAKNKDLVYNLSWCIDELGSVSKLTRGQRVAYFTERFSFQTQIPAFRQSKKMPGCELCFTARWQTLVPL